MFLCGVLQSTVLGLRLFLEFCGVPQGTMIGPVLFMCCNREGLFYLLFSL